MEETVVEFVFTIASLVMLVVGAKVLLMIPRYRNDDEHAATLRWLRRVASGILLMAAMTLAAGALAVLIGGDAGVPRSAIRHLVVGDRVVGALTAVALFMAYARLFGSGGGRP